MNKSLYIGITAGVVMAAFLMFLVWGVRTGGFKAIGIALAYPEYVSTLELQKKIVVKK